MFCPLCKAEYREGFTRCKDCDVELVSSPPVPEVKDPEEGLVLVWKGTDPGLFSQLVHSLDGAGVTCHVRRQQVHTPAEYYTRAVIGAEFELRVFEHDASAAGRILEAELERQAAYEEVIEGERPGVGEDLIAEVLPEPDGIPTDEDVPHWEAQDAGTEVWSGEDSAHAKFVRDALRENGVGYRTLIERPGHERIFVQAEDAPRAREIIGEVFEGAPSEETEQ